MKLMNGMPASAKFVVKLNRLRRGSEAYLDLLPDLLVRLEVSKRKAEYAVQKLEAFEDSLG